MKKQILTGLLMLMGALSFGTTSHAGNSSGGGGGFVIQCKNSHGDTSSQLVDLWLAEKGRGPFLKHGPQRLLQVNDQDDVTTILERVLRKAKSINPGYGKNLELSMGYILKSVNRRHGENIVLDNDTEVLSLPIGCNIKPVARFSDRHNVLIVNPDIESKLNIINKAALIVHEAIYRMKRIGFGFTKTSYSSQLEVGILFSENFKFKVRTDSLEKAITCTYKMNDYFSTSLNIGILDGQLVRLNYIHGIFESGEDKLTLDPEIGNLYLKDDNPYVDTPLSEQDFQTYIQRYNQGELENLISVDLKLVTSDSNNSDNQTEFLNCRKLK